MSIHIPIRRDRVKNAVIAVLSILLLAAVVLLIVLAAHSCGSAAADRDTGAAPTGSSVPGLDHNAEAYPGETPPAPPSGDADSPGIQIPGYPRITIPADTAQVQMALLNPAGNPCYFTFELVLAQTGETLYTSDRVAPSAYIQNVALSRGLPAGEYAAILKIRTYKLADLTEMNGAEVQTLLTVK